VRGLGPGSRVVLWVRGCTIGCKGCMTTDLWAKEDPKPIEPLVASLVEALSESDGLTVSGGEPFQQPSELAEVLSRIRAQVETNVVCYTGYAFSHLQNRTEYARLLSTIDVLIDGPYKSGESNSLRWRGSDNQKAFALNERGRSLENFDQPHEDKRELQIQRRADGGVRIIGIPRPQDMERLKGLVEPKGLTVMESK